MSPQTINGMLTCWRHNSCRSNNRIMLGAQLAQPKYGSGSEMVKTVTFNKDKAFRGSETWKA